MCAWSTPTQAQFVSGLTEADITFENFKTACGYADNQIKRDIFIRHFSVKLNGNINGTNTKFLVPERPIADRDTSGTVDSSDIEVYKVKANSVTGFDESTLVTVTSVSARDGIVTLSAAPTSSDTDSLRADYVSWNPQTSLDDVKLAASYLAAYIAILISLGEEIPASYSYSVGKFSIKKSSSDDGKVLVAERMRLEYNRIMDNMNLGKISKV
jgi:hypothetical protein